MRAVKAYYDGRAFVPLSPVAAIKNQSAIVTILDDDTDGNAGKAYLKFAGKLSDENYAEIADILKDTQKVDICEW
jgi:hypothetical protein